MANYYKMNSDDLHKTVTNLNGLIEDYKTYYKRFKKLINYIDSSADWKDKNLKTEFINCAKGYKALCLRIFHSMQGYSEYIELKANQAAEIETRFSV